MVSLCTLFFLRVGEVSLDGYHVQVLTAALGPVLDKSLIISGPPSVTQTKSFLKSAPDLECHTFGWVLWGNRSLCVLKKSDNKMTGAFPVTQGRACWLQGGVAMR